MGISCGRELRKIELLLREDKAQKELGEYPRKNLENETGNSHWPKGVRHQMTWLMLAYMINRYCGKAKGDGAKQMDLEHLSNVPIELPESHGVFTKAQQKAQLPNDQEQLALNKTHKKT